MADLALPSAVSILEAQIERKKASGQRFPNRTSTHGVAQSGAFGGAPSVSGPEIFRSARCAPNEQVCWNSSARGAYKFCGLEFSDVFEPLIAGAAKRQGASLSYKPP
eukprot:3230445-Rhodomonas_salina.3